jgi:hypothetical protein
MLGPGEWGGEGLATQEVYWRFPEAEVSRWRLEGLAGFPHVKR